VRQGCGVAPDLFLADGDEVHDSSGMVGTTIGKEKETFTDLDFAVFAEMVSELVLVWFRSYLIYKLPCLTDKQIKQMDRQY